MLPYDTGQSPAPYAEKEMKLFKMGEPFWFM